jgi:hypothetical protein
MGREALCLAEFGDWMGEGKLLLETDELVFRGASRLRVPLREIRGASDEDGWLVVRHAGGSARFDLGAVAGRWAHAISNPPTRLDKLSVKAESRVLVEGLSDDDEFMTELRGRAAAVDEGGAAEGYDLIFLRVEAAAELERLVELRSRIRTTGAIWIIHPKKRPDLSHDVLVGAAKRAGLVDTKTARFSDRLTGLKLVVPKSAR